MDAKNVIAAISLSAAVIILWAVFFPPDHEVVKQNLTEKKQIQKTSDAPSLDKNEDFMKILNTSIKNGKYEKAIFFQYTGNDLDVLWQEYIQYRKTNP